MWNKKTKVDMLCAKIKFWIIPKLLHTIINVKPPSIQAAWHQALGPRRTTTKNGGSRISIVFLLPDRQQIHLHYSPPHCIILSFPDNFFFSSRKRKCRVFWILIECGFCAGWEGRCVSRHQTRCCQVLMNNFSLTNR